MKKTESDIQLLSVKEACALLGIRRTKLFQLLRDELPKVKVGRRTLIPHAEIVAFVDRHTHLVGR